MTKSVKWPNIVPFLNWFSLLLSSHVSQFRYFDISKFSLHLSLSIHFYFFFLHAFRPVLLSTPRVTGNTFTTKAFHGVHELRNKNDIFMPISAVRASLQYIIIPLPRLWDSQSLQLTWILHCFSFEAGCYQTPTSSFSQKWLITGI